MGSNKVGRMNGVAFFPSVEQMSGNPYWPILATELERAGVKFFPNTPSFFDLKWLLVNRHKIRIINLHFIQQFYKSSTDLKKFIKIIMFAINLIAARFLGYCTVFTLHNLEGTYQMTPGWMDYLGHWFAANLSERIIVYCHEAQNLLRKRYGRNRGVYFVDHPNLITYYPNSIPKGSARNKLNIPKESFVFTFIGGVKPNKGIDLLIQAFRNIHQDNYRLVIAGNVFPPIEYAQELKHLASLDHRILLYLDHIPDDEIQVFLNVADVVVLPFSKILTSGTANLAMSFGRPVIVPRMGCLPELIAPGCGWLFEPDNPNSLAEVMQSAALADVTNAGSQAFLKLSAYDPERFAEQTIKAYGL